MLKKIGTLARKDIEVMLGVKVFLETWVKVKKNWQWVFGAIWPILVTERILKKLGTCL